MNPISRPERISALALGCDHLEYGSYALQRLSPRSAWAISVGARKDAPSSWAKGDPDFANEDALFVAEQGERTLLAVADAHFGRAPSHILMQELAARTEQLPATPEDLATLLRGMANRAQVAEMRAGTSFVVAVYDHDLGHGFGASYWDSTLAIVGPDGHRLPVAERHAGIVYLAEPATLDPAGADWFHFDAEPGDLLLAYTDGVDCCNYDLPDTSVTPDEFVRLYAAVGGSDPASYLRALVELALAGVNGNPGGEDNIAAIAVRV